MRSDIDEQISYYRARASEYDEWFLRQGRYDRGEVHRQRWFQQVAEVQAALAELHPRGAILELACGTGWWTQHLAPCATSLTAVDASPEVIELNKRRVHSPHVEYILADLFHWQPVKTYDFVFFGFWLSHVPPDRFDAFWQRVRASLKPGGCAFFVDSLLNQQTTATDHKPVGGSGEAERRLNDGRTFRIVKVFYEPSPLEERLSAAGWQGFVRSTADFFLYGCLKPPE
ncbi:MAG: class I SAM-dependent methyltransferase [Armatimonadota bacterium]|nr:class I SAM-dependent methyltransferase [Armatimonadota bacterium]